MAGCSPAALDAIASLISDGTRPLLKIQEASRAIFDKEDNRILACYCAGCVLSDGVISGTLSPVSCVNALWILFDMYALRAFLHVIFVTSFAGTAARVPDNRRFFTRSCTSTSTASRHRASSSSSGAALVGGIFTTSKVNQQPLCRHLINYPSEKFAANQCADKILLLDDSHARLPLSPNVDIAELQRKSASQLGPLRRLSSAASSWLPDAPPSPHAPPPAHPLPPMSLTLGFEAPFPRPPPPTLPVSIRELRWLNPFPEPDFIFCSEMM